MLVRKVLKMVVVVKFGGSSMANASQFEKVKNIVTSNENRKIVVVSAAGKRNSEDTKLTDLLFLLHAHLKYQVSYTNVMKMIEDRYFDIKNELNLKFDLEAELNDLKSKLNKNTNQDFLVSRGEYITAKLMSEYLGYTFVDAKDLIFFNYDGTFNMPKIKEATKAAYEKYGQSVPANQVFDPPARRSAASRSRGETRRFCSRGRGRSC